MWGLFSILSWNSSLDCFFRQNIITAVYSAKENNKVSTLLSTRMSNYRYTCIWKFHSFCCLWSRLVVGVFPAIQMFSPTEVSLWGSIFGSYSSLQSLSVLFTAWQNVSAARLDCFYLNHKIYVFHLNLWAHISPADILIFCFLQCQVDTLGKKAVEKLKESAALSQRVSSNNSIWLADSPVLQPLCLSVLMKGGKHPPPRLFAHPSNVIGLTVIWGDVLSADFQIHKSLRSEEIEVAWKARRGDWHVWVALWAQCCKLHANVRRACLYVVGVCAS